MDAEAGRQRHVEALAQGDLTVKTEYRFAIGIAAIALLVYGRTLSCEFTNWDDPMLVTENEQVLTFDVVGMFTPTPGQSYQPLRTLSHAIDYAIFGDKAAGHHAINMLLHAAAAAGLYLLLLRLLPRLRSSQKPERVALITALLFAVHPVNVEAVAWVASRKYSLLVCCSLLALFVRKPAAVGIWTLLAMFSSPFGVMLPWILVATDWATCELRKRRAQHIAIGIAALVGYPLVAIGLFGGGGSTNADFELGAMGWLWTMPRVLADYAILLVLPIDLNASYPNVVEKANLKALLALGALAVGIWRAVKAEDRFLAWLLLWGGIWLLPVANLVSMSMMMADRYLYLPAIAVFVAIGLLLDRPQKAAKVGLVAALVLLGLRTVHRIGDWQDSRSLWQASVDVDPRNSGAHTSLALALLDTGEEELARHHFEQAVLRSPQNFVAHERLGVMLLKAEQEGAFHHLREAASRNPNPSAGLLGNTGIAAHREGDFGQAIAYFKSAIERDPDRATFRNNLLAVHLQQGSALASGREFAKAIPALEAALVMDPRNVQALSNLAACHYQLQAYAKAVEAYKAVLAIQPANAQAAEWLQKSEASLRQTQ